MNVLKYLNSDALLGCSVDYKLNMLKECYGIKNSYNEDYDLYVLNYCQINSARVKDHPIVKECRSLVLKFQDDEFELVSRSFDRFFNYGELSDDSDVNINHMYCMEKVDGSLITVFFYEGQWLYRTKSMIMPSEDVGINGNPTSWKGLIENLVDLSEDFEDTESSYIMELVSPENRVVTRYNQSNIYLLAIRNNTTGEYLKETYTSKYASDHLISYPKISNFSTISDCVESSKELKNLEEGYVMYSTVSSAPILKLKSPAYVAAHRLRGELILTGKRIMDLIFMNEHEEYLSIFPEDEDQFNIYLKAYDRLKIQFNNKVERFSYIEDQKEFALKVKHYPIAGMLFSYKKSKLTFEDIFSNLKSSLKYKLVEAYL